MNFTIRTLSDYLAAYKKSVEDPKGFWDHIAQHFRWRSKWTSVVEGDFLNPPVSWFNGASLNITENILERGLKEHPDKIALIWEPNDPLEAGSTATYRELHRKVARSVSVLKEIGIGKGDTVVIYLPMIPEAVEIMLACARIGATHSVVFAGFSSQALADRINDCAPKLIVAGTTIRRGEKHGDLTTIVASALELVRDKPLVLGVETTQVDDVPDSWLSWKSLYSKAKPSDYVEVVEADHPLFILYTSGSTGAPKGVVHSSAGYMVSTAYTFNNVFQVRDESDVFWCTADIGWITGHSYCVYGPLLMGATIVLFEGAPTYPSSARLWEIVDKRKVTHLYTAPTLIRLLQSLGEDVPLNHDLSSLKVLGSVGEPINEEAWKWFHGVVGKGKCPLVDTWWQTETGSIMISPLAGITPTKPTSSTLPLPGVSPVLIDDEGNILEGNNQEGALCIASPWPSVLRTIHGDHARCKSTYFDKYPGFYLTGDRARRDEEGYYHMLGRMDDVVNVSGHRLGTAEIEDAINGIGNVVESAVIGFPHPIKGEGLHAFVIASRDVQGIDADAIRRHVATMIGSFAKPDKITLVDALPKTRSGKIMRRILKNLSQGEPVEGDVSTLLDPSTIDAIRSRLSKSS